MSFKDFVAWIVISLALFIIVYWIVNYFWIILGIVAVLTAAIGSIRVVRQYVCWLMARVDFVFTEVPEGRFKVVTRFGGHKKTLLNKEGYKLAEADELDASGNPVVLKGDIVPLKPGEQAPPTLQGGLFLIGWPGIDRLFATNMKFLKSLSSGSIESHSEELQDTFYAKVDYNYAILFRDCEDKKQPSVDWSCHALGKCNRTIQVAVQNQELLRNDGGPCPAVNSRVLEGIQLRRA
jgi:ssDNA-binding Zn-finger/Zn-ribbon topoisomerase 1